MVKLRQINSRRIKVKKILSVLFICVLAIITLSLAACNGDKGSHYPDSDEMKNNLENGGYTVVVTTDLNGKKGTHLSATKESDYIYFYWLKNAADCDYFYNYLEEEHTDYNSLVKIENDKKFGNIVYCGTKNAVDTAGIKVVNVKVDVNT